LYALSNAEQISDTTGFTPNPDTQAKRALIKSYDTEFRVDLMEYTVNDIDFQIQQTKNALLNSNSCVYNDYFECTEDDFGDNKGAVTLTRPGDVFVIPNGVSQVKVTLKGGDAYVTNNNSLVYVVKKQFKCLNSSLYHYEWYSSDVFHNGMKVFLSGLSKLLSSSGGSIRKAPRYVACQYITSPAEQTVETFDVNPGQILEFSTSNDDEYFTNSYYANIVYW
jgi:hypothetical protein